MNDVCFGASSRYTVVKGKAAVDAAAAGVDAKVAEYGEALDKAKAAGETHGVDTDAAQVGSNAENTSHSKRPVASTPFSDFVELSFGYVMDPTLVPTISKGERQTHRSDAHSAL